MSLAIDASTPAIIGSTPVAAAGTVTSNSFSPPSNSVIFMMVALDGNSSGTAQTLSSMTDNLGSHLSWAKLVTDGIVSGSLGGCAEIWWASCPSSQTGMTVTGTLLHATTGANSPDWAMLPIVFTGAATTQAGATATRNSTATGTPSLSVTGTANGSWVIGIVQNYDSGTAPTVGSGQTTTINGHVAQELNATDGDGYWAQIQTATTGGGTITISDTAPTAIHHHMVVAEVQAGSSVHTSSLTAGGSFTGIHNKHVNKLLVA